MLQFSWHSLRMFYNNSIQWYIYMFFLSVAFNVKSDILAFRKQLLDNLDIVAVRE